MTVHVCVLLCGVVCGRAGEGTGEGAGPGADPGALRKAGALAAKQREAAQRLMHGGTVDDAWERDREVREERTRAREEEEGQQREAARVKEREEREAARVKAQEQVCVGWADGWLCGGAALPLTWGFPPSSTLHPPPTRHITFQ
jgi:hypothetical protein